MNLSKSRELNFFIKQALKEDIGRGDLTTSLIIPKQRKVKAVILAKANGVVCGINLARLVFRFADKSINFRPSVSDGDKVRKGKILARLRGPAAKILSAERVALNFLGLLSGIATKTKAYVGAVKPYKVKILDTRKTLPGLRKLEKYAVRVGGGYNHRFSLDEMVLVKDNHLKVSSLKPQASSLKEIIEMAKIKRPKNIKIEVEVKNLRELKQALKARPDVIMLDNMNPEQVGKAAKIRNSLEPGTWNLQPKLEASGNIALANIRKYARCGVDFISVGSLTKDIESLDIALEIL